MRIKDLVKKPTFISMIAAALFSCGALAQQSAAMTPDTVREAQLGLAALGYSPGPATGELNAQTVDALRQLQRSRAFTPTGQLDVRTLAALGLARAPEGSGTPPASMVGAGSTAPSGAPQGATPQNTVPPGGIAQGVPLGGATPAGAPSPSFGATPAGAPSPSFGATPAGMQPPSFGGTLAGAPSPGVTPGTTTTTVSPTGTTTTVTTSPAAAAAATGTAAVTTSGAAAPSASGR